MAAVEELERDHPYYGNGRGRCEICGDPPDVGLRHPRPPASELAELTAKIDELLEANRRLEGRLEGLLERFGPILERAEQRFARPGVFGRRAAGPQ